MTERRPENEMPDPLRALIRNVLSLFHSVECQLIMEMMSHYRRMTEDRMLELLKFEKKQFQAAINALKLDKFIYSRVMLETGADGKSSRRNYFYVDYGVLTNVVKYKLYQIRTKIEASERTAVCRASFNCPSCLKTYTDLEAGELFDLQTGTLRCTYCDSEVREEDNKSTELGQTVAKFNERMAPIYSLLQTLDDTKLPDELGPSLVTDSKTSKSSKNKQEIVWSGEATRNATTSKEDVVSFTTGDQTKATPRPTPAWVQRSTIERPDTDDSGSMEHTAPLQSSTGAAEKKPAGDNASADDVIRMLRLHEPSVRQSFLPAGRDATEGRPPPQTSDPGDEETSSDEEEFTVAVGNQRVAYNDVTSEMLSRMTEAEKREYIRVGREMHSLYE